MKFDNHAKAIIAGILAQSIWGIAGPLVKITLVDVPPFSLLFLRSLFTCLILYSILEFRLIKRKYLLEKPGTIDVPGQKLSWPDASAVFWAGFTGVFLNIALYFVGQRLTTVSDAWVIGSTGALFVIAISYVFLRERLAKTAYVGAALAFVGTLVIVGTPIVEIGSGSFLGNLFMLGSVLAIAISYVLTKKLMVRFSPLLLTYYFFLIGPFSSLPFFLWEYWQNPGWLANLPVSAILMIAYFVVGSSILAYTLDNYALIHLSASVVSTIGYLSAVIAISLSIFFLHEPITPFFIAGASLVVVGLTLAESRHRSHPIHRLHRK